MEEGIKEQQKLFDAQSLLWNNYQESLSQMLTWLDNVEKNMHQDPVAALGSTQEIKTRLIKHKVYYIYFFIFLPFLKWLILTDFNCYLSHNLFMTILKLIAYFFMIYLNKRINVNLLESKVQYQHN